MKRFISVTVALFVSAGVCLSAPPQLDESTYPMVDGSTSTQTLQCLIKSKILGKDVVVPHSDTGKSYTNLIEGDRDLVLVARAPSKLETEAAAKKGVKFDAKPVALDALVFLINKANGVEGLTTPQIQNIYLGTIKTWEALGAPGSPTGPIQAHTRAQSSGSEELMRSLVMKYRGRIHTRIIANELSHEGELYERIQPMGASVRTIADKRLSLTYSVYYYVKNVQKLVDVKEKSLAALEEKYTKRLKILDESGIREKDRQYWAQLRRREEETFPREQQLIQMGLEDIRKALSGADQVKMIKVDGVEPNAETIGTRKYPYVAEVYVVIRDNEPKDGPVVKLRDWLLTSEGQKVVAESGYVAMTPRSQTATAAQPSATDQTKSLTALNVAKSVGNNKWNWTVFLKGDQKTIDEIKCVEYTLHPTFANPVRKVCEKGDPNRCFGLSATGWGTFKIGIRVQMKDGSYKDLEHQLKF